MAIRATTTVKVYQDVAYVIRQVAHERKMSVQDIVDEILRTGLKIKRIEVPDAE